MTISRKKFLQQTGLACAGTMLPFSKLFSYELLKPLTVDTRHPKNCSQDLRTPFYSEDFIKEEDFTYHKEPYPGVAKDILYKEEENVTACFDTTGKPLKICSLTNKHTGDDVAVLYYHAFYPTSTYEDPVNGHNYETKPLPLVLFFHPGGFQECADYLPPGIKTVCKQLAMRGFICISAAYRSGRLKDDIDIGRVTVQQQIAPYRGIQDGKGAIRSIFKRNGLLDRGGHNFKINPNQFFIGGQSAGAIIAMGIAYYRNQAMINQVFPVATGSLSIEQALGHINADYYYGETGSDPDNPLYTPPVRAVLSSWGGITIPKSFDGNIPPDYDSDLGTVEKGFFQAGIGETASQINPPMIGFAGALDVTIPFNDLPADQDFINSRASKFKGESFCLNTTGSYVLKNAGPGPNYNVYIKEGSVQNMYYILKELNRFTELYVDCNMHHGINDYNTDNFGVAASSNDDVFTYIAIRAAIFFQTCMNVIPSTSYPPFGYRGKSLFRSINDTSHITNQRICADDCTTSTTTCSTGTDPECD